MSFKNFFPVIQVLFVSTILLVSSCTKSDDDYGSYTSSSAPQCYGTTEDGTRCERTTNDPSGYCWQHD